MSNPNQVLSVSAICASFGNRPSCLLEILRAVQEKVGFLADDDLKAVAAALNLSRADVHGVASFYHDFRRQPAGKTVIKICLAEACQAVGCNQLKQHAEHALSVKVGETSSSGAVTLEPVYCLGNCALGPAVMVGETLYGRMTPERFDALVDEDSS